VPHQSENVFVKNGKVLVSKVKASSDISASIKKAVDLIGGIKRMIKGGETVLLKPNYVIAAPAPATTPNDFLLAVIDLVKRAGASRVIVGESSIQYSSTRRVMEELGVFEVAQKAGAEVLVFEEGEWVKAKIPGARYKRKTRYPKILDEVDRLIWLPTCKTHRHARYSGSLKLTFGITHKTERMGHLLSHLEEKIAEANILHRPDLVVMDARKIFVTGGPGSGDVAEPGFVFASGDRVAIDVEAIRLIQSYDANNRLKGISPWDLATIRRAGELGVGVKSENEYKLVEG